MVDLWLDGGGIDPKASQSGIKAAATSGTCMTKGSYYIVSKQTAQTYRLQTTLF